jgi:hypothetical protein
MFSMQLFTSHKQFEFTPRQRELMLQLAERVQAGLKAQRQDLGDNGRTHSPLAPIDQMLAEVAKFSYYVVDESHRKISLSTPLLILVLFELMQDLSRFRKASAAGTTAEEGELLRLHFFLSYDFSYHYTMEEYRGFVDGFRSEEVKKQLSRFPRRFVNTAGMDEVAVFTALYNAAKPQGRGFLHDDVQDITNEQGRALMQAQYASAEESQRNRFDYVNGRLMKISRADMEKGYIDVTTYDQYNGEGTAQRALEHLPRI